MILDGRAPAVSHMLLHIVTDTATFRRQHIAFASTWVAEEVTQKVEHGELQVSQQFPRVESRLMLYIG